jgi:hypothetical protein
MVILAAAGLQSSLSTAAAQQITPTLTPAPTSSPVLPGGIAATPTPVSTANGVLPNGVVPTTVLPNGVVSPPPVAPTAAAPSAAQLISDQIGVLAQQVAQVAHDPSLPVESKTQQITSLADQFNKLVGQWQTQAFAPGSQTAASVTSTPTPVGTPAPVAPLVTGTPTASPALITGTPGTAPPPSASTTPDQLRAQLASVSQQMAQVSQDTTLSVDAKTARLTALANQFNLLMSQLQQLGG